MTLTRFHNATVDAPFAAALAACEAAGMPWSDADLISSYRSDTEQATIFMSRYDRSAGPRDRGPFGDWRGPYLGSYWKRMRGLPTAVPGTSLHGRARALDVRTGSPTWTWLVAHGARYSITHPLPTTDAPHFEFHGATTTANTTLATPTYTPTITATQEDDVNVWIAQGATTGKYYAINPADGTRYWLDEDMLSNLREFSKLDGRPIPERTINDQALAAFRKLPGSRDWDGSIVPGEVAATVSTASGVTPAQLQSAVEAAMRAVLSSVAKA